MAGKEPTASKRTPEQIAEMENEIREFRAQEARDAAKATRESAKPLFDLVASQGYKDLVEAIPALRVVAAQNAEKPAFKYLTVYLDAVANGTEGLGSIVATVPPAEEEAAAE